MFFRLVTSVRQKKKKKRKKLRNRPRSPKNLCGLSGRASERKSEGLRFDPSWGSEFFLKTNEVGTKSEQRANLKIRNQAGSFRGI